MSLFHIFIHVFHIIYRIIIKIITHRTCNLFTMVAMATRMSFNYSHREYYIMEILIMIKYININRQQHA
jgi:hypothetical protein